MSETSTAIEESALPLPGTAAARGGFRVDRRTYGPLAKELSRLGWIRPLIPILIEWASVVLLIAFAVTLDTWWAYLLSGVMLAGRQMGLAILLHEASHVRLSPSRRINDWIGDLFCGGPLGVSLARYRNVHLAHHRALFTDEDPDHFSMENNPEFRFPMKRSRFLRLLARDLSGLSLLQAIGFLRAYMPFGPGLGWRSWIVQRGRSTYTVMSSTDRIRAILYPVLFVLVLLALPETVRLPVVLLWTIPYWTVFAAAQRFRAIADHRGVPNRHELDASRHIDARWWERMFLCPWNVNNHIVHHLFPGVPLYNLPKLHRRLMEEPEYRNAAYITRGYGTSGLLGELTYVGDAPDPDAARPATGGGDRD